MTKLKARSAKKLNSTELLKLFWATIQLFARLPPAIKGKGLRPGWSVFVSFQLNYLLPFIDLQHRNWTAFAIDKKQLVNFTTKVPIRLCSVSYTHLTLPTIYSV